MKDVHRTEQVTNTLEDPLGCFGNEAQKTSLVESLPSLVAAQKYEEKRQRYLAAKRGSIPGEPRVRFQESHPQGAPAATGHSRVVKDAPVLGEALHYSTKPQSYEQRVPSNEPPPRVNTNGPVVLTRRPKGGVKQSCNHKTQQLHSHQVSDGPLAKTLPSINRPRLRSLLSTPT